MLKKDFNLELYSVNDYHERINITNVNCGDTFMANNRQILPKHASFVSHFFVVKMKRLSLIYWYWYSENFVIHIWRTEWKVAVFGVFLVRISRISTEYGERIRTLFTQWRCLIWNAKINPWLIHATSLFLSPLKTSEIVCLSDIFRGYRKRLVCMELVKTLMKFTVFTIQFSEKKLKLTRDYSIFQSVCPARFCFYVGICSNRNIKNWKENAKIKYWEMYTNIMNYHICHTVMARASKQDLYSVSFPIKISAAGNAYLIKENLGYCKDFHCAEFFFTTRKRCHVTPSSYSYLLFFQLFWIIIQVLKIPKKLFTSEFTCGNLFNFFPKQDFLDFLEQILFGVFVVTNMLSCA